MRVILDTNGLVSDFATRGLLNELYEYVPNEHEMSTGEVIIHELRRVLADRMGVSPADLDVIEEILRDHEVVPRPPEPYPLEISDPVDKWVLATAVAGHADMLVTGDSDLLEVAPKAPLPVMTPRDFWNKACGRTET